MLRGRAPDHSAASLGAQTKVIIGEMKTTTVTVEAIDDGSRQVTVKKADGLNEAYYVPPVDETLYHLDDGAVDVR